MTKLTKIAWNWITGKYPLEISQTVGLAITLSAVAIAGLAIDASISISVWSEYLSNLTGYENRTPGILLSIALALAAYTASSYLAFLAVRKRLKHELNPAHKIGLTVATVAWLGLITISLLANLQASRNLAEKRAQKIVTVDHSQTSTTSQEWSREKARLTRQYSQELTDLKARISSVENGTSKEQGYHDGKRGNTHWKGALTVYGRALLADLHRQLEAKEKERANTLSGLDATFSTRIAEEKSLTEIRQSKQDEKREETNRMLRMIILAIYPLSLLASLYLMNLYHLLEEPDEWQPTTAPGAVTGYQATGYQAAPIGYRPGPTRPETAPDFDQMKADILREIRGIFESEKAHDSPVNVPPIEHRFTSERQPDRAPKKHGQRADAIEAQTAILAAFNAMQAAGTKPTYDRLAAVTGYSKKCVGNHIREMKRQGKIDK